METSEAMPKELRDPSPKVAVIKGRKAKRRQKRQKFESSSESENDENSSAATTTSRNTKSSKVETDAENSGKLFQLKNVLNVRNKLMPGKILSHWSDGAAKIDVNLLETTNNIFNKITTTSYDTIFAASVGQKTDSNFKVQVLESWKEGIEESEQISTKSDTTCNESSQKAVDSSSVLDGNEQNENSSQKSHFIPEEQPTKSLENSKISETKLEKTQFQPSLPANSSSKFQEEKEKVTDATPQVFKPQEKSARNLFDKTFASQPEPDIVSSLGSWFSGIKKAVPTSTMTSAVKKFAENASNIIDTVVSDFPSDIPRQQPTRAIPNIPHMNTEQFSSRSAGNNDGWDDWDDSSPRKSSVPKAEPSKQTQAAEGWDDWEDEEPAIEATNNDGWDDWNDEPVLENVQASKSTLSTEKKASSVDGWDDWNDEPEVPQQPRVTRSKDVEPIVEVKKAAVFEAKPIQSDQLDVENDGWDEWNEDAIEAVVEEVTKSQNESLKEPVQADGWDWKEEETEELQVEAVEVPKTQCQPSVLETVVPEPTEDIVDGWDDWNDEPIVEEEEIEEQVPFQEPLKQEPEVVGETVQIQPTLAEDSDEKVTEAKPSVEVVEDEVDRALLEPEIVLQEVVEPIIEPKTWPECGEDDKQEDKKNDSSALSSVPEVGEKKVEDQNNEWDDWDEEPIQIEEDAPISFVQTETSVLETDQKDKEDDQKNEEQIEEPVQIEDDSSIPFNQTQTSAQSQIQDVPIMSSSDRPQESESCNDWKNDEVEEDVEIQPEEKSVLEVTCEESEKIEENAEGWDDWNEEILPEVDDNICENFAESVIDERIQTIESTSDKEEKGEEVIDSLNEDAPVMIEKSVLETNRIENTILEVQAPKSSNDGWADWNDEDAPQEKPVESSLSISPILENEASLPEINVCSESLENENPVCSVISELKNSDMFAHAALESENIVPDANEGADWEEWDDQATEQTEVSKQEVHEPVCADSRGTLQQSVDISASETVCRDSIETTQLQVTVDDSRETALILDSFEEKALISDTQQQELSSGVESEEISSDDSSLPQPTAPVLEVPFTDVDLTTGTDSKETSQQVNLPENFHQNQPAVTVEPISNHDHSLYQHQYQAIQEQNPQQSAAEYQAQQEAWNAWYAQYYCQQPQQQPQTDAAGQFYQHQQQQQNQEYSQHNHPELMYQQYYQYTVAYGQIPVDYATYCEHYYVQHQQSLMQQQQLQHQVVHPGIPESDSNEFSIVVQRIPSADFVPASVPSTDNVTANSVPSEYSSSAFTSSACDNNVETTLQTQISQTHHAQTQPQEEVVEPIIEPKTWPECGEVLNEAPTLVSCDVSVQGFEKEQVVTQDSSQDNISPQKNSVEEIVEPLIEPKTWPECGDELNEASALVFLDVSTQNSQNEASEIPDSASNNDPLNDKSVPEVVEPTIEPKTWPECGDELNEAPILVSTDVTIQSFQKEAEENPDSVQTDEAFKENSVQEVVEPIIQPKTWPECGDEITEIEVIKDSSTEQTTLPVQENGSEILPSSTATIETTETEIKEPIIEPKTWPECGEEDKENVENSEPQLDDWEENCGDEAKVKETIVEPKDLRQLESKPIESTTVLPEEDNDWGDDGWGEEEETPEETVAIEKPENEEVHEPVIGAKNRPECGDDEETPTSLDVSMAQPPKSIKVEESWGDDWNEDNWDDSDIPVPSISETVLSKEPEVVGVLRKESEALVSSPKESASLFKESELAFDQGDGWGDDGWEESVVPLTSTSEVVPPKEPETSILLIQNEQVGAPKEQEIASVQSEGWEEEEKEVPSVPLKNVEEKKIISVQDAKKESVSCDWGDDNWGDQEDVVVPEITSAQPQQSIQVVEEKSATVEEDGWGDDGWGEELKEELPISTKTASVTSCGPKDIKCSEPMKQREDFIQQISECIVDADWNDDGWGDADVAVPEEPTPVVLKKKQEPVKPKNSKSSPKTIDSWGWGDEEDSKPKKTEPIKPKPTDDGWGVDGWNDKANEQPVEIVEPVVAPKSYPRCHENDAEVSPKAVAQSKKPVKTTVKVDSDWNDQSWDDFTPKNLKPLEKNVRETVKMEVQAKKWPESKLTEKAEKVKPKLKKEEPKTSKLPSAKATTTSFEIRAPRSRMSSGDSRASDLSKVSTASKPKFKVVDWEENWDDFESVSAVNSPQPKKTAKPVRKQEQEGDWNSDWSADWEAPKPKPSAAATSGRMSASSSVSNHSIQEKPTTAYTNLFDQRSTVASISTQNTVQYAPNLEQQRRLSSSSSATNSSWFTDFSEAARRAASTTAEHASNRWSLGGLLDSVVENISSAVGVPSADDIARVMREQNKRGPAHK